SNGAAPAASTAEVRAVASLPRRQASVAAVTAMSAIRKTNGATRRLRMSSRERISHLERLELPDVTVVRVARPDAVLEQARRDVRIGKAGHERNSYTEYSGQQPCGRSLN